MRIRAAIKSSETALRMLLSMTILLAVILPLLVTAISQLIFPTKSNGSLIMQKEQVIGSLLLGQNFTDPRYFWGRLSATTPPYNPAASAASNISPGNGLLLEKANERMAHLQKSSPGMKEKIPLELITASASGLDPHITPQAAYYQINRVAKERKWKKEKLRKLVDEYTELPLWGVFGEPRVNVLSLNLALDAAHDR